ncbi:hypothetical protein KY285_031165 [Solanum tuberosum]|nr:hypothetical protein KY285_031165 [Solanum tuberosum]
MKKRCHNKTITWYSLLKKAGEEETTTSTPEKQVSSLLDKPTGHGTGSQNSQYGPGIIILLLSVFTGGTTRINLQMNYHKQRLDITFILKH